MPLLRAGVWGLLGKGDTSMVGFDHQGRGSGDLLQKVHHIKFGIFKWRRNPGYSGQARGGEQSRDPHHMASLEPDFCEDCDKTGGGPRQYTIK